MTYGLQCINNSNELTLSSDGALYGYIGKATYVSTTPPGTSTTDSFNGYSTYQITWPGDIIIAAGLPASASLVTVMLLGKSKSGSTWTIKVFCSDGTSNSLSFDNQRQTDVYVWGRPTSVSGYGMALYDSSGNLAGDLSRAPLTFRQRVTLGAGVSNISIPTYSKVAILGYTSMSETQSTRPGVLWQNRVFAGAWQWDQGSNLLWRVKRQVEYFEDDGGIAVGSSVNATSAILIEASGLT